MKNREGERERERESLDRNSDAKRAICFISRALSSCSPPFSPFSLSLSISLALVYPHRRLGCGREQPANRLERGAAGQSRGIVGENMGVSLFRFMYNSFLFSFIKLSFTSFLSVSLIFSQCLLFPLSRFFDLLAVFSVVTLRWGRWITLSWKAT